jgi:predicted RNase H-like HicB family nuclease
MREFNAWSGGRNNPRLFRSKGEWRKLEGRVYSCLVYLTPEAEGGFSAVAAQLPGVASKGGTEPEALSNIVETLKGALAVYNNQGVAIPWNRTPPEPERGALSRWVLVRV